MEKGIDGRPLQSKGIMCVKVVSCNRAWCLGESEKFSVV